MPHPSVRPPKRLAQPVLMLAVLAYSPSHAATGEEVVQALRSAPGETLEGVNVSSALLLTGQRAARGTADGAAEHAVNTRADLELELPAGRVGNAEGRLFAHVRAGHGSGLENLNPTLTGAVNSTPFATGTGKATATLAQLWYQLDIPVGAPQDRAAGHVALTVGKIDPFVFFDQNNYADDESEAFLDNVFVHNPLLDSGGDVGGDAYGFAPGVRLAYFGTVGDAERKWGLSVGLFGAGPGVSFDRRPGDPFAIVQAEYSGPALDGLDGAYRLYAWRNARATPFNNAADAAEETHAGWGFSADQQVASHAGVFVRYGHATRGRASFDRAFTLGLQVSGVLWGREDDVLGVAHGWLHASRAFRTDAPALDADADGTPDFGYAPQGTERQTEMFYNWRFNAHLMVSPDIQWLHNPAADRTAESILVWGIRLKAAF